MTRTRTRTLTLVALALLTALAAACGEKQEPKPAAKKTANPAVAKLTLKADPGEATSVIEAKDLESGDEVIVEGRIDKFVRGFATFTLVDTDLDYCGAGADPQDNCPTPWDYCCIPKEDKVEATLTVEAVDANGNVLKTDAIPDLRLLDLVAIQGKILKDEHGNVRVQATGWYRRERPKLPDGLRWP